MLNSNDLINKVKVYNKFLNPERLDKAFNFAVKAHQNQKVHGKTKRHTAKPQGSRRNQKAHSKTKGSRQNQKAPGKTKRLAAI